MKEERTQQGLNKSFKHKAGDHREYAWQVKAPNNRELPHFSSLSRKVEENKKRTKRETDKEVRTNNEAVKHRRTREAGKNTSSSSSRSKPRDKERAKTVEQPQDQGGEIVLTYESPDLSTVVPGQYLPQYLPPNPLLPHASEDIKSRKLMAQDP